MDDLVTRIRNRPNDAPMPTERLLDDAADEIDRCRAALAEIERLCAVRSDMSLSFSHAIMAAVRTAAPETNK